MKLEPTIKVLTLNERSGAVNDTGYLRKKQL
jgi:hypothetical protein